MSAPTTTGRAAVESGALCESCGQAPVSLLLHLGGTAPFAVCGGCAFTTLPAIHRATNAPPGTATCAGEDEDRPVHNEVPADVRERAPAFPAGSPPLDFVGSEIVEQTRWEVVWPIVGTVVPGVAALAAWFVTCSPVALVVSGVLAAGTALLLDSRRSR